ncbi:tyrosine-type recombinase/integrase [Candidatus Saccharibacteria bacterium]|nr:tyrosine-type recombinase/integrase [Candidatus Saccharibacteria bacterium]
MKISEAFAEYRESEIIAANLSSKTLESYFYSEKRAIEYFGDVGIETLTAPDVRSYYEHLLTWQKPDTARGNIVCLRAVVKLCRRNNLDVLDPELIKVPKREKRIINYLTEQEVQRFVEVVGAPQRGYSLLNRQRNVLIVKLLYSTGLRVGELCRLNRNSFRNRQAAIYGKSKLPRPVYIPKDVENLIEQYLKNRDDSEPALLISEHTGKRITPGTVRLVFRNACARSEFENIHPHTLRHSFATKMLDKEVDLRYIADLMGHESLDTTRIYTHYTNPKLRSIYDRVWKT